jgi:Chitobiase/beta-hexosaminidase C-terminal domain
MTNAIRILCLICLVFGLGMTYAQGQSSSQAAITVSVYLTSEPVATPEFSPPPGTYDMPKDVTVTCDTPGATIHFTLDMSEPTESSPIIANGATVPITGSRWLKAKAFKSGITPSDVKAGAYIDGGPVATPVFSPPPGTYEMPTDVTVTCATPGATIRFTLNMSEPTESSPIVANGGTVHITGSRWLKAKAFKSGMTPSATMAGTYIDGSPVATPVFSPPPGTYEMPMNVTVSCATPGATIRFTLNMTEPTESSPIVVNGGTVPITGSRWLKAKVFKSGMTPSATMAGTYVDGSPVAKPVFSPPPGTYEMPTDVTVTCATPGATIRFTLNMSEPTESSPIVANGGTVHITGSRWLKAKAFKSGMTPSATMAGTYVEGGPVATPEFSPPPGAYCVPMDVVVTCATPGATIRFTLDMSEPTESSPIVADGGTVRITGSRWLKAKAFKSEMPPSDVVAGTYIEDANSTKVAIPEFSPPPGTYCLPMDVVVTCATPDATIRYTLDMKAPTESSPIVANGGTVTITGSRWLKVRAFKAGMTPSDVKAGTYIADLCKTSGDPIQTATETDVSASGETSPAETLEQISMERISEKGLPLSEAPAWPEIAIRLMSDEPVDEASAWAVCEGDGWVEEGGRWRPTDPNDGRDGWVVFEPEMALLPGEALTLTVGAVDVAGVEVGPVTRIFRIGAESLEAGWGAEPSIAEMTTGDAASPVDAETTSAVYRIGPQGVFDEAIPVWIPVPDGAAPDLVEVYYFSEADEHSGWYPAENVIGWMVPGSRRTVIENGETFIEIWVNHSGLVQLASP